MKYTIILFALFIWSSIVAQESNFYHGHPVISATSTDTDYKVDEEWYSGWWSIAPHVAHDTLQVTCYGNEVDFVFKTDQDSIHLIIKPNTSEDFYVFIDDQYAHTIITGIPFTTTDIEHTDDMDQRIIYQYPDLNDPYLAELRAAFPIDALKKETDKETVLAVLDWTHSRWNHSGNNSPSKNDAITILQEAAEGSQFPCFAYAIVLRDQLASIGYKARTVYLKTKDAKTRQGSPGHVATEVYLPDLQKWVFIDGQFNVMPTLHNIPLNAIEFQRAINDHFDTFQLESKGVDITSKINYIEFIYDYLYYLDTSLDHRYDKEDRFTIDNMRSVMLVPADAPALEHVAFWDMEVDYCLYTHSIQDFYKKP